MKLKSRNFIIEILIILFVVGVLIGNTIVNRTFQIPGTQWNITTAFPLFAGIMIVSDILVEVLGKKNFIRVIFYGFGANLIMALIYTIVCLVPTTDDFTRNAYNLVIGQTLLVFIASLTAYLVSSFANAGIMWLMKAKDGDKKFKLRAWLSTVTGQIVDNGIFFILGLGVLLGLPFIVVLTLFITNTVFEVVLETACLPLTHALVKRIKSLPVEIGYYD